MKKFLSMVLALVMTMSLVTMSAGAKDFTDDSKITYKEAVDVVSAIGIVDGYTDGSFNPGNTLTRGAAAKIICNLILGTTTAGALSADAAPFKDVPANHEFAGYIAFCAQQGIISGYADGTFRPAGTLTGYAFLKMLLGALGYDATIEQFVGNNWSVQVAKTALGIGLDDDIEGEFNGQKAVTREQACLFAFNTLKADMVEYDNKGSSITVGGVEISTGASKATTVTTTKNSNTIFDERAAGAIEDTVQFGEQFFPRLVLTPGDDDFQRPSHLWAYKGDEIGTYADKPDASYISKVTFADIYDDAKLTSTTDDFVVYVDGIALENYENGGTINDAAALTASEVTIDKGNENDKIGTGNGCIVEVYKTGVANGLGVISVINNYVGEIIGVEEKDGKTEAYAELGQIGNISSAYTNGTAREVLDNEKFDTEEFEVGDIVIFNYSLSAEKVKTVELAEKVEGNLTSFTNDKKFAMGDKSYSYGEKKVNIVGSSDVGTDVVAYLDANGYAMYYDEGEENIKNYALVLRAGNDTYRGADQAYAKLLFADGTTKTVDTDKYYGNYAGSTTSAGETVDSDVAYEWVTYKTNSDGEYVLSKLRGTHQTILDNDGSDGDGTDAAEQFVSDTGKTQLKAGKNGTTNLAKVNSTTTIIVMDKNGNYNVYEGVKNMPTIDGTTGGGDRYAVYTKPGATYAKLVFVEVSSTTSMKSGNNKVLFLNADKGAEVSETANDQYYVFDAVVDGVVAEDGVMLDYTDSATAAVIDSYLAGTSANLLAAKSANNVLLLSYSVDKNGFYTVAASDMAGAGSNDGDILTSGTIKKVSGTVVDFDGSSFVMADDCVFYRVDDQNDLKKATASSIRNGDVGVGEYYAWIAYTVNSDQELTGVYYQVATN